MPQLFVSIVLPALNEAQHIEAVIESLRPDVAALDYEMLVVDGGSLDGTRAIVRRLQAQDSRIRLIDNPQRTQAAALNLAAREADSRARILVRADCHAAYPRDFVSTCLSAMQATGAASVVVPMETSGRTCLQRAIAAAQNSRLGNGGSLHRTAGASGYVDHGHHAAFDRAIFLGLGGYSEDMPANEDAEFDARLTAAGHRIWLCGDATMTYYPRDTWSALARQYFRYGFGRASTCLRHKIRPKMRQMLPVVALAGCALGVTLAPFHRGFLTIPLVYAAVCVVWGAAMAWRDRSPCLLLAGPAAMVMHLAWGAGFCVQLLRAGGARVTAPKRRLESREVGSPPA